jgi:hypothetical protein
LLRRNRLTALSSDVTGNVDLRGFAKGPVVALAHHAILAGYADAALREPLAPVAAAN